MPGKQSKLRYRAMLAEVEGKAQEAFRKGVLTNPYPLDDKRHERFTRRLRSMQAAAFLVDF